MAEFVIISSEVTVFKTVVEAETKEKAIDKLKIDANDFDYTYGWQIESVEEL